jgi:GDP-L-fucose synthase
MEKYSDPAPINIGVGQDHTIKELAEMVRETVDFQGEIKWDTSQPDGTPRKLLDVNRIRALGWESRIDLKEGIRDVYRWFSEQTDSANRTNKS